MNMSQISFLFCIFWVKFQAGKKSIFTVLECKNLRSKHLIIIWLINRQLVSVLIRCQMLVSKWEKGLVKSVTVTFALLTHCPDVDNMKQCVWSVSTLSACILSSYTNTIHTINHLQKAVHSMNECLQASRNTPSFYFERDILASSSHHSNTHTHTRTRAPNLSFTHTPACVSINGMLHVAQ